MVDVLNSNQRRLNMSRIRGKNTKPEILIRSLLHGGGFRFRIHRKDLPGKPDIVLQKHHTIIFVHGCFWHGHKCPLSKIPETRQDFWLTKISSTNERDSRAVEKLIESGWKVIIIWECSLRGIGKLPLQEIFNKVFRFIYKTKKTKMEIRSNQKIESNSTRRPVGNSEALCHD